MDGSRPTFSAFNCHRAALSNLFQDCGQKMSESLRQDLKAYFRGLKRKSALAVRDGEGRIKVGKEPLTFSLYRYLGLQLLIQPSRDFVFARWFMILCGKCLFGLS